MDWAAILTALETALTNRLTGARGYVADYTVRGRSVRYMTLEELTSAIDWARQRKAAASAAGGPFAYGVAVRARR